MNIYEEIGENMGDNKEIVYSERFNFYFIIVVLLFIASMYVVSFFNEFIKAGLPSTGDIIIIVCILILFIFIIGNFTVLKITITKEYVEARYGLFYKRVSLNNINSASSHKYKFTDYWGWGIRGSFSGTVAYNIPGDKSTGVLLEYDDLKTQKTRQFFFSCRRPEAVIKLIVDLKTSNN